MTQSSRKIALLGVSLTVNALQQVLGFSNASLVSADAVLVILRSY